MGSVGSVRGAIVKHRVEGRHERFNSRQAGKHGLVANFVLYDEGRTLRDLMAEEVPCALLEPCSDTCRLRGGSQVACI